MQRYTIGQIAAYFDIAPSTVRYYDKEGLLPALERSQGNVRVFTDKDFETLTIIECLKKSGLQIKDIKDFMSMVRRGDETIDERLQLFARQRETILSRMRELQDTLAVLDYKVWYYKTAKRCGSTAAVEQLDPDLLPDDIRRTQTRLIRRKPD